MDWLAITRLRLHEQRVEKLELREKVKFLTEWKDELLERERIAQDDLGNAQAQVKALRDGMEEVRSSIQGSIDRPDHTRIDHEPITYTSTLSYWVEDINKALAERDIPLGPDRLGVIEQAREYIRQRPSACCTLARIKVINDPEIHQALVDVGIADDDPLQPEAQAGC